MASKEILRADHFERRWPVVLQLLVVVGIATHPARIHIMPLWFGYSLAVACILPMVAVGISRGGLQWTHLEHWSNLAICALGETVVLLTLYHIITEMLKTPTAFTGEQLLTTSIAAWATNVVTFSVVYLAIGSRGAGSPGKPAREKARVAFPTSEWVGRRSSRMGANLCGLLVSLVLHCDCFQSDGCCAGFNPCQDADDGRKRHFLDYACDCGFPRDQHTWQLTSPLWLIRQLRITDNSCAIPGLKIQTWGTRCRGV